MSEHTAEKDALLDIIEREYEAFRRHHAAAQTRESPEGFARLFREWIAPAVCVTPPVEHRLVGTGCTCGKWKARLGESITRGFDLHLLDRRCASCGEPIPTTKRVDAETCSDRCAKDRQRARVTSPGEGRA